MDPELRDRVSALFPAAGPRRTRVAVEHEIITARSTGEHAPIEAVRAATRGSAYSRYLGFEPGGQVELSLPCAGSRAELASRLRDDVGALRRDLAAVGIAISSAAVDPRPESAVPLQLTSRRYLAMQAHFDSIGPAGRRMMRRTASTQVCLDWWSGRAGLEQWRLMNLAAPFLAAAFARSAGPQGRLATWLAVDPSRTAFDDRLLHGDDPVAAYADLAATATVFVTGGTDEHLSTLFPPVRPRGQYLEVRFPDAQPVEEVGVLVDCLATLLYDDDRRAQALALVEPEQSRLGEHWESSATGDLRTLERGLALVDLTAKVRVGAA